MKHILILMFMFFSIGSFAYAQDGGVGLPGLDGGVGAPGRDGGVGLPGQDGGVGQAAECGESIVCLNNPLAAENITQLFETIIDVVLIFAVPLIVFFIIYAGFLYVTARGNEGTIEKAHKALLYALIGGLLILGARVLIVVVQGTVDCVRGIDGECS